MTKIAQLLIPLVLTWVASLYSYDWFQRIGTTHVWYSVIATPDVIKPGDKLVIQWDFYRKHVCKTEIAMFVVRLSDSEVVWRNLIQGGASGFGRFKPKTPFTIPTLPDGQYVYKSYQYSQCTFGFVTSIPPEVPFTISSEERRS